ncbi:hypothetical protein [Ferrimonas balearica]|uniref:hypothetical protein n=1 Tax=Ferrimonas balearica TaxID=44012 RepID=UPI001C9A13A5|nr:hypothetical protein [Ferrimonas balearica]MBY5991328.1 hypothetical protein [Ferrimonas balearica]
MDEMTRDALNKAYQAQCLNSYKVLSQSLLEAQGDPTEEALAQERFQKALAHAKRTHSLALELAGLND